MEKIVIDEEKKGKKVGGLLERMDFHETLYIASLEIVIFSYSSPTKTFPWALETFNVAPFNFYKVIEILIRIEDGLARDVVKHLQSIEEQILERFAWKSSSPFWSTLELCEGGVPSADMVAMPRVTQFCQHKNYLIYSMNYRGQLFMWVSPPCPTFTARGLCSSRRPQVTGSSPRPSSDDSSLDPEARPLSHPPESFWLRPRTKI